MDNYILEKAKTWFDGLDENAQNQLLKDEGIFGHDEYLTESELYEIYKNRFNPKPHNKIINNKRYE